jgi:hypothetical protein
VFLSYFGGESFANSVLRRARGEGLHARFFFAQATVKNKRKNKDDTNDRERKKRKK